MCSPDPSFSLTPVSLHPKCPMSTAVPLFRHFPSLAFLQNYVQFFLAHFSPCNFPSLNKTGAVFRSSFFFIPSNKRGKGCVILSSFCHSRENGNPVSHFFRPGCSSCQMCSPASNLFLSSFNLWAQQADLHRHAWPKHPLNKNIFLPFHC